MRVNKVKAAVIVMVLLAGGAATLWLTRQRQ